MRTKYKQRAVDYIKDIKNNQFDIDNFDIDQFRKFVGNSKVYIEIGPGKGQFILNLARANPDKKFIVCEYNMTIAGICLKKIDENVDVKNIRMVANDFFKLGEKFLENNIKIDEIFLNFSDPRPKKRHEKRRLTSDLFLLQYANLLKDDGYIYFKSDNTDFSAYSLEQFKKFKFAIEKEIYDYQNLDEFDASTEFEEKYKMNGIKIKRFVLKMNDKVIKKSEDLL